MELLTANLTGNALDWVVQNIEFMRMQAEGEEVKQWVLDEHKAGRKYNPYSTDWAWAGEIIDREDIQLLKAHSPGVGSEHLACIDMEEGDVMVAQATGNTKLEAAMRCYVLYVLGEEVDVPELTPRDQYGRPMVCSCCGTTKNLHADLGSDDPYRCSDPSCVVF